MIVSALLAVGSIVAIVWHFSFVITPLREKAFRRYGSVENYVELVSSHENAEVIYTDRYITVTPFAISIHKRPLDTLDVYDILAIYKAKRSTETIVETESLVIVDAWGEQNVVQYRRRDRKRLDVAIAALREVCDDKLTKFGETVESIEWIGENFMPLPKYDRKTKSIQAVVFDDEAEGEPKKKTPAKKKSTAQKKTNASASSKKSKSSSKK